MTLSDGDSGSPNPIYAQVFGANTMPYSGPYALMPDALAVPGNAASQPPGWDFDAGTNLYIGIDLGGVYINCGYMGQTPTFRVGANGATDRTFTGFPGVVAMNPSYNAELSTNPRYAEFIANINALSAEDRSYAVTGWFSVPSAQLLSLYANLQSSGILSVGLYDFSPGDQNYDFTQGVGPDVIDIPVYQPF